MSSGPVHFDATAGRAFALEADAQLEVRRLSSRERAPLLDWLDDGLRGGRRGRLAAEYGAVLDEAASIHVTLRFRGRPACHALARVVECRVRDQRYHLGMIGLVYTDPAFRRRGLAGRCIESACEWLEEQGAEFAALWSDRHDFYARLGFCPAGRERFLQLDAEICAHAAREFSDPPLVRLPEAADWSTLETLYAAKAAHVGRAPGLLRSLAAAPDSRLCVAGPQGRPRAYAVRGRGDDFPGIVHEWAGEPGSVLACLSSLLPESGSLGMIAGPAEEPVEALCRAGADLHDGFLALARRLSPVGAFAGLPPGFFLWGFDSI